VTSIRKFLILAIVATLILFNFIAALRGYQSSMAEADTLFDNQLLDLSQLVSNLDVNRISREFRLGNNLAFQIWEDDMLLAASFHAPREFMTNLQAGFDFSNFDGYRWRTYTRHDDVRNRWVIVAERTDLRFILAENVVLESVTPILIGIPMVGLVIWVVVSFGLSPLTQLSSRLGQKKADDLAPIELQQTPAELAPVLQSVNGFIKRLSVALDREKRFSSDAAHELRTPISALKIQLHNLQQEVDTKSEAYVELQRGVERMQHLVEQLLSLYRSSPDQFAADCKPVDLHEITQDVVARYYPMIEARNQNLELDGQSCRISGDRFALETMVNNLLSNASKYTPEGGSIRLHAKPAGDSVVLIVEDDGPGIEASERQKVFDRFYRTGHSGSKATGCGLGLTIVQHVADLHGAKVTVEDSSFGRGVAFRVDFPVVNP
jgi:two-component system sensor histidine kinase QseC